MSISFLSYSLLFSSSPFPFQYARESNIHKEVLLSPRRLLSSIQRWASINARHGIQTWRCTMKTQIGRRSLHRNLPSMLAPSFLVSEHIPRAPLRPPPDDDAHPPFHVRALRSVQYLPLIPSFTSALGHTQNQSINR